MDQARLVQEIDGQQRSMTCPENAVAEWERSGWERESPAPAAAPEPPADLAPADTPPATGRRGGRGATTEKES